MQTRAASSQTCITCLYGAHVYETADLQSLLMCGDGLSRALPCCAVARAGLQPSGVPAGLHLCRPAKGWRSHALSCHRQGMVLGVCAVEGTGTTCPVMVCGAQLAAACKPLSLLSWIVNVLGCASGGHINGVRHGLCDWLIACTCVLQVLDAYTPVLRSATPSDTSLLLVTIARLQHVSSYTWLQGVLDHCQDSMMAFDGQVHVEHAYIGCATGCTVYVFVAAPRLHRHACWQGPGVSMCARPLPGQHDGI